MENLIEPTGTDIVIHGAELDIEAQYWPEDMAEPSDGTFRGGIVMSGAKEMLRETPILS